MAQILTWKENIFTQYLFFRISKLQEYFYDNQNQAEKFAERHKQNNNQAEWTYLTDKNIMYPTAPG